MTLLTKTQTATARNGTNLFRVSIGGKRTRTLKIKSRQPKNGFKPWNSLGSACAMLNLIFFFFFFSFTFQPMMKRETERC